MNYITRFGDTPPTRGERRKMDREVRRLVAQLEGAPLPGQVDVTRDVGLLREGQPLLIASKAAVRLAIGELGFADVIDALEREPPGAHAGELPIIMWIGDWLTIRFVGVLPLASGGST